MKKIISITLAIIMIFGLTSMAFAADVSKIDEYIAKFELGVGPEVNGIAIDYMSYTPENLKDGVKYPVVVFFHGMDEGSKPGAQIAKDNLPLWASEELQQRFVGSEGAFIIAPRSHEEDGQYWPDNHIEPVKAAINDFIAKNADYVDISRIYVGGFSMGGKMTIKMLASYPEFFAAGFPMCPAYAPSEAELKAIADIPLWLIVSRYDVIAGWYTYSKDIWSSLKKYTSNPDELRLSLIGIVYYPDGKKTSSNHHVWFAQANDLFTYEGKDYYKMTTTDATGAKIKLEYPNGLINWLSSHTSNYNGTEMEPTGVANRDSSTSIFNMIPRILRSIAGIIFEALTFQIDIF